MARSPYLEAKVNRWCKDKRELVIEDCDLVTFNIIVDYMYGIAIPDSVLIKVAANTDEDSSPPSAKNRKVDLRLNIEKLMKLLEMSDRLLMVDLKDEVEELLIEAVDGPIRNAGEFIRLRKLAEILSCDKLLAACAKKMASRLRGSKSIDQGILHSFYTRVVEKNPKFAAALLMALHGLI